MVIDMYSELISNKLESPTTYGARSGKIDRITPHCVVGNIPAMNVARMFASPQRKASSNYIIGKDGEIVGCVPEDVAACTSHSSINDKRAITIECASGLTAPYKFEPIVVDSLVNLTVDIMKRYNKKELVWIPEKIAALDYNTGTDKMIITLHRWFDKVECPGAWLIENMETYVSRVNKALKEPEIVSNIIYRVQVGAFKNKANAERLHDELKTKGYNDCFIKEDRL